MVEPWPGMCKAIALTPALKKNEKNKTKPATQVSVTTAMSPSKSGAGKLFAEGNFVGLFICLL